MYDIVGVSVADKCNTALRMFVNPTLDAKDQITGVA
jgi:hypothetical protein